MCNAKDMLLQLRRLNFTSPWTARFSAPLLLLAVIFLNVSMAADAAATSNNNNQFTTTTTTVSRQLLNVRIIDHGTTVVSGQSTAFWCEFDSTTPSTSDNDGEQQQQQQQQQSADPFRLQSVTWTRIYPDGRREFVYDLDRCAGTNEAFGSLAGRAHAKVIDRVDQELHSALHESLEFPNVGSGDGTSSSTTPTSLLLQSSATAGEDAQQQLLTHGIVVLHLRDVRASDEGRYECLVKPFGRPAAAAVYDLSVTVRPRQPTIELTDGGTPPFAAGHRLTLTCSGDVGRPPGSLAWLRIRPGSTVAMATTADDVTTQVALLSNGTSWAVSRLVVTVTAEDDGTAYRCVASSHDAKLWDGDASAEYQLRVQYGVRDPRITYNAATGLYACDADGQPTPEFAWLLMAGHGASPEVVSAHAQLNVADIRRRGNFSLRCLASNVVSGQRFTKLVDTLAYLQGSTNNDETGVASVDLVNTEQPRLFNIITSTAPLLTETTADPVTVLPGPVIDNDDDPETLQLPDNLRDLLNLISPPLLALPQTSDEPTSMAASTGSTVAMISDVSSTSTPAASAELVLQTTTVPDVSRGSFAVDDLPANPGDYDDDLNVPVDSYFTGDEEVPLWNVGGNVQPYVDSADLRNTADELLGLYSTNGSGGEDNRGLSGENISAAELAEALSYLIRHHIQVNETAAESNLPSQSETESPSMQLLQRHTPRWSTTFPSTTFIPGLQTTAVPGVGNEGELGSAGTTTQTGSGVSQSHPGPGNEGHTVFGVNSPELIVVPGVPADETQLPLIPIPYDPISTSSIPPAQTVTSSALELKYSPNQLATTSGPHQGGNTLLPITYSTVYHHQQVDAVGPADYDDDVNIPADSYFTGDEEIPLWNVGNNILPYLDTDPLNPGINELLGHYFNDITFVESVADGEHYINGGAPAGGGSYYETGPTSPQSVDGHLYSTAGSTPADIGDSQTRYATTLHLRYATSQSTTTPAQLVTTTKPRLNFTFPPHPPSPTKPPAAAVVRPPAPPAQIQAPAAVNVGVGGGGGAVVGGGVGGGGGGVGEAGNFDDSDFYEMWFDVKTERPPRSRRRQHHVARVRRPPRRPPHYQQGGRRNQTYVTRNQNRIQVWPPKTGYHAETNYARESRRTLSTEHDRPVADGHQIDVVGWPDRVELVDDADYSTGVVSQPGYVLNGPPAVIAQPATVYGLGPPIPIPPGQFPQLSQPEVESAVARLLAINNDAAARNVQIRGTSAIHVTGSLQHPYYAAMFAAGHRSAKEGAAQPQQNGTEPLDGSTSTNNSSGSADHASSIDDVETGKNVTTSGAHNNAIGSETQAVDINNNNNNSSSSIGSSTSKIATSFRDANAKQLQPNSSTKSSHQQSALNYSGVASGNSSRSSNVAAGVSDVAGQLFPFNVSSFFAAVDATDQNETARAVSASEYNCRLQNQRPAAVRGGSSNVSIAGCQSFYRCANDGQGFHVTCPRRFVFNNSTGQCERRENVSGECGLQDACQKKPDGYYADVLMNCTAYYRCTARRLVLHNFCLPGLIFDDVSTLCDMPEYINRSLCYNNLQQLQSVAAAGAANSTVTSNSPAMTGKTAQQS